MKKVIHISDLHIGHEEDGFSCENRAIFLASWMRQYFVPNKDYVVVITGDLVDDAQKKHGVFTSPNYDKARRVISILTETSPEGQKGFEVFCVPGNHDYRTRDEDGDKVAAPEFDELFRKTFLKKFNGDYPLVRDIGGIRFIGLNSMEAELFQPDRRSGRHSGDGRLGSSQLDGLTRALDEAGDRVKVVCLHHHPLDLVWFNLQLRDAKEFKKAIIGKNVSAVLFGHNHMAVPGSRYDKYCSHSSLGGIPCVFDAGSATVKQKEILGGRVAVSRGYCIVMDFGKGDYTPIRLKYEGDHLVDVPIRIAFA